MDSRYSLMEESEVVDPEDNEAYPDILSMDLDDIDYSKALFEYNLNMIDVRRTDLLVYKFYRVVKYADIILWLNDIDLRDKLQPEIRFSSPN
jgi:hypothetical protein